MFVLLEDERARPDLFVWHGPLPAEKLDGWVRQHGPIPEDLRRFWLAHGGGEFFETETILSPFGDALLGDDVLSITDFHRGRGLAASELVFYVGQAGIGTVDTANASYRIRDETNHVEVALFPSLSDWYQSVRADLAANYQLE